MSTGSSLVEAASLLKLYDVKQIHIFVAHALGTSAVEQLLEIGNGEVIATSSIPSVIGKLSPAQDVVSLF
jgi:phosphoribosylpyrophosphate synthetase